MRWTLSLWTERLRKAANVSLRPPAAASSPQSTLRAERYVSDTLVTSYVTYVAPFSLETRVREGGRDRRSSEEQVGSGDCLWRREVGEKLGDLVRLVTMGVTHWIRGGGVIVSPGNGVETRWCRGNTLWEFRR